jgi:RNA polymerase sigma factor (sigma-70 family)
LRTPVGPDFLGSARPSGWGRRLYNVTSIGLGETTIDPRGGSLRGKRFEDLYLSHGAEALRVAYLMTGDRVLAEDVAQEAFVRLLKRFHDLRHPDAFRAYLLRTVVNLTKSHFRKLKRERDFTQLEAGHRSQDPVDIGLQDMIWSALLQLPERQRTALVLRYCQDLSEQQTADVMQISLKALKSLVGRGLAKLRSEEGVTR